MAVLGNPDMLTRKIKLCHINAHITCRLCEGYLIDATTVTECLHTFCRSCLVKYLEENNTCPTCRIVIHQSHPLQYIGWVRNHRKAAHTHKRAHTHSLTHTHSECHQLCSASKQTAEDQRASGPFPFDFCSSAGNKNPPGVVRLLSFVDLHLAQKHLKPTPIHSSVFCARV